MSLIIPTRMYRSLVVVVSILSFAGSITAQAVERDRGIELYRAGSFAEASSSLAKAVEADKGDKLAWMYLGASLHREGKSAEAIKAFDKAVGSKTFDADCESSFKFTKRIRPTYTDQARENGEIGTVWAAVEYLPDGQYGFIVPVKKLRFGLTENALGAIRRTTFTPGTKDGKSMPCVRMVYSTFSIY